MYIRLYRDTVITLEISIIVRIEGHRVLVYLRPHALSGVLQIPGSKDVNSIPVYKMGLFKRLLSSVSLALVSSSLVNASLQIVRHTSSLLYVSMLIGGASRYREGAGPHRRLTCMYKHTVLELSKLDQPTTS